MTKALALNILTRASAALYSSGHDVSASRELIKNLSAAMASAVVEARAHSATEADVEEAIDVGHAKATAARQRNARRAA